MDVYYGHYIFDVRVFYYFVGNGDVLILQNTD